MFIKKFKKNKFKQKRLKQNLLFRKKKKYKFIKSDVKYIDYKNLNFLKNFLQESGEIIPARFTNIKSNFQRQINIAIKRARFLALLPYINFYKIN